MNNATLTANVCHACTNIWFCPDVPHEDEPSVCPFCKNLLLNKKDDLIVPNDGEFSDVPTKDDLNIIFKEKTSNGFLQKVCKFCKNNIIISKTDSDKNICCPYCGDEMDTYTEEEVIQRMQEEESATHNEMLMNSGVMGKIQELEALPAKYKIKPHWFSKSKIKICVLLEYCIQSKLAKLIFVESRETKWIPIDTIKEINELSDAEIEQVIQHYS